MGTQRFNYNDKFNLKDQKVGISSNTPEESLDVASGTLKGFDLQSNTGITTFSTYEGFQNKKTSYTENVTIDSGVSGTLSGEVVIGVGLTMSVGTGATSLDLTTSGQGSINTLKVSNTFTPPIGGTNDRPSAPQPGALYYNKDFRTIEYWDGNFWRQVDNTTTSGRGIVAGGFVQVTTPNSREIINYINIPSKGNSQYFGDLTESRARCSAAASSTRACIQMGQYTNKIDYITIASTGNAADFGDTGSAGAGYRSAASSSTRGLWAGGYVPAPTNNVNSIDYITIATVGNALDFGDLRGPRWSAGNSGCSNSIRGVFSGGYEGPNAGPAIDGHPSRTIDFVNIASTGNAIDFGKLIANLSGRTGLSNSVRGIWGGGANQAGKSDSIGYITIASEGNAEYFGDLSLAREMPTASSTQTRGTFAGGRTPSFVQVIDYVTIATTGNSVNFGQLTDQWFNGAGFSDSHGGLGGF